MGSSGKGEGRKDNKKAEYVIMPYQREKKTNDLGKNNFDIFRVSNVQNRHWEAVRTIEHVISIAKFLWESRSILSLL